jgi:predicted cupin superfamily sugar epimerase
MHNAAYYIEQLGLLPHPEGGYYKEVHRATEQIAQQALPSRYDGDRSMVTSIYFMLTNDSPSHFHRIKSDEIWYFHAGGPIRLHQLDAHGRHHATIIGSNLAQGQVLQCCIEAGNWFAAECVAPAEFGLVSCMVAPGFDFKDFELATTQSLIANYPAHASLIQKFT